MIIISCAIGEKLGLTNRDDQITIKVLDVKKSRLKIGVNADEHVEVWRKEAYLAKQAELSQRVESYHYQYKSENNQFSTMDGRIAMETKPRILLVEDTEIIIKANALLLKTLNCEVDVAATGREAIDLWSQNQYDLVLLDIGLPDISGVDVCKVLRKNEKGTRVPIVFLTALGDEYKESCFNVGADDFAVKPVFMEVLDDMIKRWLPNMRMKENQLASCFNE